MKVAVVYNRESKRVINLFGMPNQERIGQAAIHRIVDALKKGRHQVKTFEGDKELIDNLEEFMPQVLKGERPGMVFNVSYGIQGQARYTHIPSILEMVGVPYVGSGPLAHSLSLDKVVTKMMLRQHGLPTPEFVVLDSPGFAIPEMPYPLIVKPKNEAVSFGISIVNSDNELRQAAQLIFDNFRQPVLVERYIDGREINVGLIGNSPVEALPPCEIVFGEEGPKVYRYEDKTGRSGRHIGVQCPAQLSPELTAEAQRLAIEAFKVLNCYDCARVDMRLDAEGNLYILEINSLPSLGEHGSYVHGAEVVGLNFSKLVNRLVEVASARYFGTPSPPAMPGKKGDRTTSEGGQSSEMRCDRFSINRLTDQNRFAEFPSDLTESDDSAFQHAGANGEAGGDRKHQQAMGDPLPEVIIGGELGVSMDLVEITRDAGKIDHVGLGHGAASSEDLLSNFIFFKPHPTLQRQRAHIVLLIGYYIG